MSEKIVHPDAALLKHLGRCAAERDQAWIEFKALMEPVKVYRQKAMIPYRRCISMAQEIEDIADQRPDLGICPSCGTCDALGGEHFETCRDSL